jgi:hypothetical protein
VSPNLWSGGAQWSRLNVKDARGLPPGIAPDRRGSPTSFSFIGGAVQCVGQISDGLSPRWNRDSLLSSSMDTASSSGAKKHAGVFARCVRHCVTACFI